MKFHHWKIVAAAIAVGVPMVWAITVLDSDRPRAQAPADAAPETITKKDATPQRRSSGPAGSWQPRRSVPQPSPEPEEQPEVSHEERVSAKLERATAEETSFVAAFESQTVDTEWAPVWEEKLDQQIQVDLGELPGFAHSEVECRSDKCLATVTWDDYASATSRLGETINLTKGECATFSFMPPPENAGGSYRHKVRFGGCRSLDKS